jgi:hypothetical protein
MPAPLIACIAAVAAFYHLPASTLVAIQKVEAGRLGLVHANRDGSQDLGPMQINTRWLRPLSRQTNISPRRLRWALLSDACFNVAVGGAVLRLDLNARRGDLLQAIGDYHSRTPGLHEAYQARVLAAAVTPPARAELDAPAIRHGRRSASARWRNTSLTGSSQANKVAR